MATKITNGNHQDSLSGSTEKRLDVAPDGTMWAGLVTAGSPGSMKFFRSSNGGSTWAYASGSDLPLSQSTAVPSLFIDGDGFAHVSWITWANNPQQVMYARGVPAGGGGWRWTIRKISPALGRLGVDSDVIAFRAGSGWVAWVSWNADSGGHTSRVRISASGAVDVEATISGPHSGGSGYQLGSMEFAHVGDGKTPAANPDIYYTNFRQGSNGPININRARYSGGSWTWEAPVQVASSVNILRTALVTVFDGTRLVGAYVPANSSTISVFEWTPGGSVVSRNPPGPPGGIGMVPGISMSIDPQTNDVYLAFYDVTDGDIRWSKLTRSSNTWSAWAVAASLSPPSGGEDGKINLVRHPPRDSVDMLYATGGGANWSIFSMQLVPLVRAPSAPSLISPPSGALLDLGQGGNFSWRYNPVSPGDTQAGWYFRRKASGGSDEYWNEATKSWQGSAALNVGDAAGVAFPAGKWTSGTTYVWSVRTRSSTGSDSAWANDRIVTATSAPVVVVTGPIGIVYGESTPLIEWTYTGLDPQRSFDVAVFTEAQMAASGFDPATSDATWRTWSSSAIARSARVGVALADGVGYYAFARATSSIGVTSAWSSVSFGISINPPIGPVVELRQQDNIKTGCPRIRLDVLAQSNHLGRDQSFGDAGWEVDANVTIAPQADDSAAQLLRSLKITSAGVGLMSVRTAPGSPPAAPYGQPQPAGPLDFPVTPGAAYTAQAAIKGAGEARAARVAIRWYDADDGSGELISESVGNQVVIGGSSYVPAIVTDLAPPRARLARMTVQILGALAAGEEFWMTRASFAPGRAMTWAMGGYAATQTVRIERSVDGGETWELAVDRIRTDFYQRAIGADRLMPYRTDVKYRAATVVDIGSSTLVSDYSLVSTIRIDAESWSFRDPDDDGGEIAAIVTEFEESDDEASSVHRPAGRFNPVVDTEGLRAATGSVTFFAPAGSIEEAKRVVRRTVPMVMQSPSGRVMRVRFIQRDYEVAASRHREIKVRWIEIGD